MDKHKKEIEKFGFYSNWDDSKEYLLANPHLACEDTANYLTYWCVNLQMEEVCELCLFVCSFVLLSMCIVDFTCRPYSSEFPSSEKRPDEASCTSNDCYAVHLGTFQDNGGSTHRLCSFLLHQVSFIVYVMLFEG